MSKNAVAEIRLQLDNMVGQFAAVLPKHIPVERFGRVVLTAVQTNPDLLNVDRRSLWNACMKAAQDGLMPDGRLGALVVYRDRRRGQIAQWLPMIAGIRQKVRNSGEVATWEVHVVYEKDLFDFELGDEPHIIHRPVRGERGKIIAAYSVALLKTGERSREVMWIDEIEAIRKQSRSADSGPWVTHYSEMCRKTVARRHAKVLPMSSDLDDLLRRDDEDDDGEPGGTTTAGKSAVVPVRAPARNLTDALNVIASMPAEAAYDVPDRDPDPDGEQGEDGAGHGQLIEDLPNREAANHGT